MRKLLFTGMDPAGKATLESFAERMRSATQGNYFPEDFFNYGRFHKEGKTRVWEIGNYALEIYNESPYYALFRLTETLKYPIKKFKLSSYAWQKAYRDYFQVLDPDGWNREDLYHSMSEKISRNEFLRRVYHSTCRFNLQLIKFI